VILERFFEAKIFEKRPNIFAKNDLDINIDKNIALEKRNCQKISFCYVLPFGKRGLLFAIKKTLHI
jgi:hypothetical protein